jgi:hypothetical protein
MPDIRHGRQEGRRRSAPFVTQRTGSIALAGEQHKQGDEPSAHRQVCCPARALSCPSALHVRLYHAMHVMSLLRASVLLEQKLQYVNLPIVSISRQSQIQDLPALVRLGPQSMQSCNP